MNLIQYDTAGEVTVFSHRWAWAHMLGGGVVIDDGQGTRVVVDDWTLAKGQPVTPRAVRSYIGRTNLIRHARR